jgi:hypothetical protein
MRRTFSVTRSWRSAAWALAFMVVGTVLAAGCARKPRAPALLNEPVYQNSWEGFRFLIPEGWTESARSDSAPPRTEKEWLVVRYELLTAEKPATLEVTLADVPETADLSAFLSGPSHGHSSWHPTGPAEELQINVEPAVRLVFTSQARGEGMIREVTSFRRGGRVYCFTGMYPSGDTKARDEIRRAVGSVLWKK